MPVLLASAGALTTLGGVTVLSGNEGFRDRLSPLAWTKQDTRRKDTRFLFGSTSLRCWGFDWRGEVEHHTDFALYLSKFGWRFKSAYKPYQHPGV